MSETNKLKFKADAEIVTITDDWWYMLHGGGYIKPTEYLEESDAEKVQNAIDLLASFINQGVEEGFFDDDY